MIDEKTEALKRAVSFPGAMAGPFFFVAHLSAPPVAFQGFLLLREEAEVVGAFSSPLGA